MPGPGDYEERYYAVSEKVIGYENSTVIYSGKEAEEIAIPLKKSGKRTGFIRIGIKN